MDHHDLNDDERELARLVRDFADEVVAPASYEADRTKTLPMHVAERLVGRAGRIAQIVPSARPFAAALYAAQTAAKRSSESPQPEAPPRQGRSPPLQRGRDLVQGPALRP